MRFDADAVLDLWRFDIAGVVPKAPARIVRDHTLIEIAALQQNNRTLSVLVRRTFLSPWLRPGNPPRVFVVLKAPAATEADAGGQSGAVGTLPGALSRLTIPGWHGAFFLGIDHQRTEWTHYQFTSFDTGDGQRRSGSTARRLVSSTAATAAAYYGGSVSMVCRSAIRVALPRHRDRRVRRDPTDAAVGTGARSRPGGVVH